jgi:hypothetical protein
METNVSKPGFAVGATDDPTDRIVSMLDEAGRLCLRLSDKLLAQFWEGTGDPIRSLLAHERMAREVRATMALRDKFQKAAARTRAAKARGASRAR